MDTQTYLIIYLSILLVLGIIIIIFLKKKQASEEKKAEQEYIQSAESDLAKRARSRAQSEAASRAKMIGLSLFFTFFGSILAKLWEWWYTPKKVLSTAGLLAIFGGVWGFLTLTNELGEIAINVRDAKGIIPPKNIEGLEIVVEARDSTTPNFDLMPGVMFKPVNKNMQSSESWIQLTTNEDGIAYASYSGHFDPKNMMLQVKILASNSKQYETQYHDETIVDSGFKAPVYYTTVYLQRKRPMVRGTIRLKPDFESLEEMKALGVEPPNTFTLDIYLKDVEDNPAKSAKFLVNNEKEVGQIKANVENRGGGSFILEEIEINKQGYYLHYEIEDSSQIKVKLKFPDEFAEQFKFDEDENGGGAGGGFTTITEGEEPNIKLNSKVSAKAPPDDHQYSFTIVNEKGKKYEDNEEFELKFLFGPDGSQKSEYKITGDESVIFPDNVIESLSTFWEENSNVKIKIKGSSREFKKWKTIKWRPKDLSKKFKDVKIKFYLDEDDGSVKVKLAKK